MARRHTVIGTLFVTDTDRAAAEILECLRMTEGKVRRAAVLLGVCDRHLYRMIAHANLWPTVHEIRRVSRKARAETPEWLKQTRKVIHG